MKAIFHATRKDDIGRLGPGLHGFLKLIDTTSIELRSRFVFGEEIHFRKQLVLSQSLPIPSATPENTTLRLRLNGANKKRTLGLMNLVEVERAEDSEIQQIWDSVVQQAQMIDGSHNVPDGTNMNCHVLLFKSLERAGLTAPRDHYNARIKQLRHARAPAA